ncbi:DUF1127 domain-containing protein [Sneathiella marina]|uniref:DUF1127 domain-containing protein n=1 Tax=Sneathiella marina TaxID=2950108 RepID=A0ABY4W006_9PROT|nr:DUF1127 domain-containing protein [Sneathiella marina]USG60515.1 DUF1127 domain-containing protein [Sneathiella marina]
MSDILGKTHCGQCASPAYGEKADNSQFSVFPAGLIDKFHRWRRARAAQWHLLRASDRTLKDIGVTRREIRRGLPRADDEILAIERRRFFK